MSAFNNAGFALFSDNLMGYRGDVTINLVITTLIIAGGLGFFVLSGLLRLRKRTAVGMSVHTKLVLTVTACLLAGGTLVILALEWANPNTLGPLGFGEKLLAAYFQAVTPRTAGFNTISIGDMTVAGAVPHDRPDVHRRVARRHRRRREGRRRSASSWPRCGERCAAAATSPCSGGAWRRTS